MEGYNESEDPARILRWNYDPLGRLVSAETRDGSAEPQLVNSVSWTYDAYGSVASVTENHGGVSYTISYSYTGPGYVGGHYIAHRRTGYAVGSFKVSWTYGASGGVSDMLGRAEKTSWSYGGVDYEAREEFMGRDRWVKMVGSREYDTGSGLEMKEVLCQEIPSSGGFDRFGRPVSFQGRQTYDPTEQTPPRIFIWNRSYAYESGTGWLSEKEDTPGEGQNVWGPQSARSFVGHTGFGEVNYLDYSSDMSNLERTWIQDAFGDWECYTEDFPGEECESGCHTRCYNRRGEIEAFTQDDCPENPSWDMIYDEAGRLRYYDHPEHGVGELSFSYDAWGRLREVTQDETNTVTYTRDALGRLIRRSGFGDTCGAGTRDYFYGTDRRPLFSDVGGTLSHYVKSGSSGRFLAETSQTESRQNAYWYLVGARGEIFGIISFEGGGTYYRFYWYSPTGALEEEQQTGGYEGCNDLFGDGGWIWEEAGQFSIRIDLKAVIVILHKIAAALPRELYVVIYPNAGDLSRAKSEGWNPLPSERDKPWYKRRLDLWGRKIHGGDEGSEAGARRHIRKYRSEGKQVLEVPVDYRQGALKKAVNKIIAESLVDATCVKLLEVHGHGDPGLQYVTTPLQRKEGIGMATLVNAIDSTGIRPLGFPQINWCRKKESVDADFWFYGCRVGHGEDGRKLMETVHKETGCKVHASTCNVWYNWLYCHWGCFVEFPKK